ncbi:MAG: nicotinate-nucleotide adenylyltransferase [Thermoanaerobaculia bacterium]|nr:nicotinate-nucleotide adenylyltransferase [Thermoanaerobaculia bacterium]
MAERRIGILGGTFDPFHYGHLRPMLTMKEKLGWSEMVFIPAWTQPFKSERSAASPFHRHAMAVLGTEQIPGARVSIVELERGEISYSIDTLRQMRAAEPDATLEWVIGDDNLERLTEWRDLDAILELANFVVLRRGSSMPAPPEELEGRVHSIKGRERSGSIVPVGNDMIDISATEIRRKIRKGESWDSMVPSRVARYIRHNDLYAE